MWKLLFLSFYVWCFNRTLSIYDLFHVNLSSIEDIHVLQRNMIIKVGLKKVAGGDKDTSKQKRLTPFIYGIVSFIQK